MFLGEYHHSLDEKGRLAIPAKFREALKGGAVATKGLDNCLFLYPKTEWEAVAAKMASLPFNKANDRALARHFLAGAMDLDFDSQGRTVLPEYLRNFASLKKKIVVAGLYNRLEIWDEEAWEKYKTDSEKETNAIAEALDGIG
ncbi:MAG: division/cell wall cluster transcriptional repressor MraZ [Patescibacteria group bacterium]|nr:division/cell wall cluster transcriptional repressor MraZ [Patescibacteria group bacterium]